ncbi:MAG: type II toxin-antitoxin system VapC family toxin [Erythrobacter sp.]
MIVVDASLALKWYLDEALSDEAEAWFAENEGHIVVPPVFLIEVTGALVRRANIDSELRRASETSIARFVALFDEQLIKVENTELRQMVQAASLALDLGHPLKDCIYLALAMELGCDLVTCDARFAAKAKVVWPGVRMLGE